MVFRFNLAVLVLWVLPLLGQSIPQTIVSVKRNKQHAIIPILTEGCITIVSVDNSQEKNKKIVLHEPYLMIHVSRTKVSINNHKIVSGTYHILVQEPIVSIYNKGYRAPLTLQITPHTCVVMGYPIKEVPTYEKVWMVQEVKETVNPYAYKVKVLIDELISHDKVWHLKSEKGFIIGDPKDQASRYLIKDSVITIKQKREILYVNNQRYNHQDLYIYPNSGYAWVDERPFYGAFYVTYHGGKYLLINHVDLEEYVYGVLKTESWPGWPLEVNKVFAISSRSYVMAMIKKARKMKLPYHVKNTNEHQTYQGMHVNMVLRAAVDQTKGIFLGYNNEPALTMFDCCCGGVIPAHIESFNFADAPYLARDYACTYCKKCSLYKWEANYNLRTFHEKMQPYVKKGLKLTDVRIVKKDKAGLIKELHLKQGSYNHSVTGQQFYRALKDVRSFCFTLSKKDDLLTVSGRGFGHHMGVCQWGARQMVREGWSFSKILQFYYPGTQFMRLSA